MLSSLILHENQDFLVVNKPPGVSIHSEAGPGLIASLRSLYQSDEIFPVHRIDVVTSGLLLVARNPEANRELSLRFQDRKIEKIYLALLDKKPRKTQGCVRGDMLKARGGSWRLAETQTNPAQTWFFSFGYAPKKRVAVVKPLTGKTHQIRVAMKAMGAPIVGDERYGGSLHSRTCLHAWQLRFAWQGKTLEFYAPFQQVNDFTRSEFDSEELAQFVANLGSPFDLDWPKAALHELE